MDNPVDTVFDKKISRKRKSILTADTFETPTQTQVVEILRVWYVFGPATYRVLPLSVSEKFC